MKTAEVSYFAHRRAVFEIRSEMEHQQRHWLAGSYYEASNRRGMGLLNWIYQQGRYHGGVCVDVGASLGNHTVFFALVCGMRVVAIEPHAASFNHLCANVALNGIGEQVTALACACGERAARGRTVEAANGGDGEAGVVTNAGMVSVVLGDEGTVAVERLDVLLDPLALSGVDFIKIDVEHQQEQVVWGALSVLRRYEPDLYVECESPRERERMDIILRGVGYERRMGVVFNHTPTYLYETRRAAR